MSWRDTIPIHPAADLFPLLGRAELRELADDIKANGLHERVKIIERPRRRPDYGTSNFGDNEQVLIDGRNRLDAMELAGVPICATDDADIADVVALESDDAITAYVISANIRRRHLTGEQKRELIGKLLELDPSKSNRQIAATVKADDKTVGSVRRDKERRAEIPHVAKTVDTKGRKQPANKPPKSKAPGPATVTGKQEKITKAYNFGAGIRALLRALEMHTPKVIALIVKETADDLSYREDIQSLRDQLNDLLISAELKIDPARSDGEIAKAVNGRREQAEAAG